MVIDNDFEYSGGIEWDNEDWDALNVSACHGTQSKYFSLMTFEMVGIEKLITVIEDDNQVLTLGVANTNDEENNEKEMTVVQLTKEQLRKRLDYFYKNIKSAAVIDLEVLRAVSFGVLNQDIPHVPTIVSIELERILQMSNEELKKDIEEDKDRDILIERVKVYRTHMDLFAKILFNAVQNSFEMKDKKEEDNGSTTEM